MRSATAMSRSPGRLVAKIIMKFFCGVPVWYRMALTAFRSVSLRPWLRDPRNASASSTNSNRPATSRAPPSPSPCGAP